LEIVSRVIKRTSVGNIAASREEFRQIFDDLRNSGGSFTPTATWLLCQHPSEIEITDPDQIMEIAGSDEVFQREFSDLEQRMHGWIGGVHAKGIADPTVSDLVKKYASFLDQRDPLSLWKANVADPQVAASLRVADLGSLMDLSFIHTYAFDPARKITTILEVGGGYGRLAEAALNVFGESVRYVLIDSVPVSLYYAKQYLEKACPHVRVGSYYAGDPFDLDQFNCYVMPAWYFEELNKAKYDVCINIESFQEMNQQHIDTYLQLFDRVSVDRATFYFDNARDYIFRGGWSYPNHWQKLFGSNTPRSWSPDHPAEVFVKSKGDFSAQNAMLEDIHHFHEGEKDALLSMANRSAARRLRSALGRGRSYLKGALGSR
jgi:hypothetical protein